MEIPNGTYRARGTQGMLGETSTGKEQVAVEFELLEEGFVGTRIAWFGYFTDKTQARTIETLRNCGWQGTDLTNLEGVDANEVSLVIEQEEYEGKWSPRVRWVNIPGSGLALKSPLSADKAKAFAARMRGQIAAIDQAAAMGGQCRAPPPSSGRAPAPAAADPRNGKTGGVLSPEPPPYGNDESDIPF